MNVEEIEKLLKKKDISPELKRELEKRKEALINGNQVNK